MKEQNQIIRILYKLSNELLVFTVAISFFYFLAESILPGIFSNRVSPLPFFMTLVGSSLVYILIGQFVEREEKRHLLVISKKQGIFFSLLFTFFVLSDGGKLGWGMYIFLFSLIFLSFFLFLLIVFYKEKENV